MSLDGDIPMDISAEEDDVDVDPEAADVEPTSPPPNVEAIIPPNIHQLTEQMQHVLPKINYDCLDFLSILNFRLLGKFVGCEYDVDLTIRSSELPLSVQANYKLLFGSKEERARQQFCHRVKSRDVNIEQRQTIPANFWRDVKRLEIIGGGGLLAEKTLRHVAINARHISSIVAENLQAFPFNYLKTVIRLNEVSLKKIKLTASRLNTDQVFDFAWTEKCFNLEELCLTQTFSKNMQDIPETVTKLVILSPISVGDLQEICKKLNNLSVLKLEINERHGLSKLTDWKDISLSMVKHIWKQANAYSEQDVGPLTEEMWRKLLALPKIEKLEILFTVHLYDGTLDKNVKFFHYTPLKEKLEQFKIIANEVTVVKDVGLKEVTRLVESPLKIYTPFTQTIRTLLKISVWFFPRN